MEVTGTVKNNKTNETIVGATVFKSDALGKPIGNGVQSDIDGKYKLGSIEQGDFVTAQIIGMKPLTQKATSSSLNFNLEDSSTSTLGTFEVIADKPEAKPKAKPQQAAPKKDKTKWIMIGIGVIIITVSILAIRKISMRKIPKK
jgi:hypothetical protein